MSSEAAEPPKTLKRVKSVNFGVPQEDGEDCDVPRSTTMSSSMRSKQLSKGKQRSFAAGNFEAGKDPSKSRRARRRRRFWRRVFTVCAPSYWFHVLDRTLPIINEYNPIRRWWDSLMLALVIWACCIIPYEVGFGFVATTRYPLSEPDEERQPITPMDNPPDDISHVEEGLQAVEFIMTALFAIDICVNFRTSYTDKTASVVRDGRKICIHYGRTWFPLDFIATVPWDMLILAFLSNPSETTASALLLLRTPRILRLARLLQVFDRLPGVNFIRLTKLLFFIIMVAHWMNCGWFFLFRTFRFAVDEPWSMEMQLGMNSTMVTYYLNGYYNTFMLMIGNDIFPGNDIERMYSIFVQVIGACFYAIIIGNISLLINNMNPTNSRHNAKKDIINNSVRYLGTPKPLANKVDNYFEYLTTRNHPGPDGMLLFNQLPPSMHHDITYFMYGDLVKKVPLFEDCEVAFILQLVVRMKMTVYQPGEAVFQIGDVGHEMYFISKGTIAVKNKINEMLALLTAGGFFGELALLATSRRTAECVAMSYCDLSMLTAHDLVTLMRDFPESARKVEARAAKRLQDLQIAGAASHNTVVGQSVPHHLQQVHQLTHPQSDSDDDYSDNYSGESDRTDNTDRRSQGGAGRDGKQRDREQFQRDQNREVDADEDGDMHPDEVERLRQEREGWQQDGNANHGKTGSATDEAGSREPVVLDDGLVGSEGGNRVEGEQAAGHGGGQKSPELGGRGGQKSPVRAGDGGGGGGGGRRSVEYIKSDSLRARQPRVTMEDFNRSGSVRERQTRSNGDIKAPLPKDDGKLFDVIKREMARNRSMKQVGSIRRRAHDNEAKKSGKEHSSMRREKEETDIRKDLQGVEVGSNYMLELLRKATALAKKLDLRVEGLSETMCGVNMRVAQANNTASTSQLPTLDLEEHKSMGVFGF